MNSDKRPLSLTILACIYIAVGAIGFVSHLNEFHARHAFQYGAVLVELTELLAIICGVFMLHGQNWARWLALTWMAFHVVLSLFHTLQEFAIHCLFCAAIAWFLFRPQAARYFRRARVIPI